MVSKKPQGLRKAERKLHQMEQTRGHIRLKNRYDPLSPREEAEERRPQISYLASETTQVNVMSEHGWTRRSIIVDTGAEECVAPPSISTAPAQPSVGSQKGQSFSTADGGVIENQGEKTIVIHPEHSGKQFRAKFQIANVVHPLMSVAKMTDRGSEVTFTKNGGYVVNAVTKEVETWFPREGNLYKMHTWVEGEQGRGARQSQCQQHGKSQGMPFARQEP